MKTNMESTGRAFNNSFVERFWRSLKYEEVYLKSYESVWDCRQSLKLYLEFYNQERVHQGLESRTPAEVHFGNMEQKVG